MLVSCLVLLLSSRRPLAVRTRTVSAEGHISPCNIAGATAVADKSGGTSNDLKEYKNHWLSHLRCLRDFESGHILALSQLSCRAAGRHVKPAQ